VSFDPCAPCRECGSPLDQAQQYCLGCGRRVGGRSPQLEEVLRNLRARNVRDAHAAEAVGAAMPAAVPAPTARGTRAPVLALPAARVSALLVAAFLGFGVLLGAAAGSPTNATLASSRAPLRLLLPPQSSASPAAAATASSAPPPSEEATPTPSPSTSESAAAPAAAPPTAPASKSQPSPSSSEGGASGAPSAGSKPKPPAIKHVFVIMLADEPYASLFGPASTAPYLSQTLEHRGELLERYYAVAHQGLPNGIALLSGQGPTVETAAECPNYTSIEPAVAGADEQVSGSGCVYPKSTQTLAGQLTEKHLSWRAYIQGMDEPGAAGGACAHPVLGQPDPSSAQPPPAGQTYATSRNPFVYFHSVIDSPDCATDDVGLSELSANLSSAAHTPSFSYIAPDACHDGSATPCAPGAPAGPAAADGFLQKVVGQITSSRAYKKGGLLVITADQAPSSGPFEDSSSCCGQPKFPNLPAPASTVAGLPSKGGGQVGALLLSPFIKGGTTDQEQFNHFSLLRTIEGLFALGHLGYAALPSVSSFPASLFSASKPAG
jgi:phosphatidylinositol-3-phosphatase